MINSFNSLQEALDCGWREVEFVTPGIGVYVDCEPGKVINPLWNPVQLAYQFRLNGGNGITVMSRSIYLADDRCYVQMFPLRCFTTGLDPGG
jgi:hypothetical protein